MLLNIIHEILLHICIYFFYIEFKYINLFDDASVFILVSQRDQVNYTGT